jgi:hypothetical protein
MSALCAALECFEVEVVAIERPDRLLVDRLLAAGVLIASCCVGWRALIAIASDCWSRTVLRDRTVPSRWRS